MGSFLGILKKIGAFALGIEHVAAPIVSAVFPQYAGIFTRLDGMFQRLIGAVVTAEQNNPADKQGPAKAEAVKADFEAGLEATNAILAQWGKKVTYDAGALTDAVTAQVAAFNAMARLKASFKEEPLVP